MITLACIVLLQAPQWIWAPGAARDGQTVHFRARFTVEGKVTGALLHATCDNRFELFINNGRSAASGDDWESPVSADVASFVKEGVNVIAVKAVNDDGPGALIVRLKVGGQTIVSDATWRVSEEAPKAWRAPGFDDAAWKQAAVIAPLGGGPWGRAVDAKSFGGPPPAGPAATAPESITALPGFKVELLYSVPKETEGSWVNLTFDPRGRLIVSDQYGKLYRITIDGMKIEPIELMGKAHGLLYAFDSLYVMVGEGGFKGNGLYRVRDTDGDDAYDSVELLRNLKGSGEHGPHAILLHPDGKSLVVVAGNHTDLPEFTSSQMPRVWQEDHLLPRMWDAGGHAVGRMAPGGWLAKVSPDGKEWELIGAGFRNEFDAAFNREGDLFTYDSDMEWDVNTPWYRPTRICHVIRGAEFGWRSGSGKWPVYYPDSLPPVVDIGPGSPTGVCFGIGAKFPAKYQEALFACDWSYGKLYAVHLKPSGSSYTGVAEEFLKGSPLPLTDVVIGPKDGAMYFTIGGRRTKSGLYRVTYVGTESTAPAVPAASKEREERRRVEASPEIPWQHFGSSDRFLRFAARTVMEHRPPAEWQERALKEGSLTALLALARTGDKAIQPRLLEALDRIAWKDLDETGRLELLRVYGLAFLRMGPPDAARYVARFDPLFPAASIPLNAELCRMLIYLEAPSAAAKTIALLEKAPTQEEQMNYAFMLRNLKEGWTPELRERYFKWFPRAAHYKGGHSFAGFVKNIKKEAVAKLPPEALAKLKPILEAEPPPAESFSSLAGRTLVKAYTTADAPAIEKGLTGGRNYDRGRDVFGMVGCFKCHRFAGEGGSTGPDLTGAGGRFSPRDLLESIVEPSKTISDQYGAIIVKLTNGDVVRGRIVNLSGDNITINTDNADPDAHTGVDRKRIASIEPSPVSVMPERLIDVLKEDEVMDLVAFLISGGDRKHASFR